MLVKEELFIFSRT